MNGKQAVLFAIVAVIVFGVSFEWLKHERNNKAVQSTPTIPIKTSKYDLSEHASVQEALKPLRRLESATVIGVSFAVYSARLIDAKADFDGAMSSKLIPDSCRYKLDNAFQQYLGAHGYWSRCIARDRDVDNKLLSDWWSTARTKIAEIADEISR